MFSYFNPYHIVDQSPWPITAAMASLSTTTELVQWFHTHSFTLVATSLLIMTTTSYAWWQDVTWESTLQGQHTSSVAGGLQ